jgi:hypothetical protein
MVKWHFIIFVFLWICIPDVSCAGTGPAGGLKGPFKQKGESAHRVKILIVQNNTKKSSDSTRKDDETGTKGETFKKEKDDTRKRKQLEPFVPSETIPADQGVDFPYDI